MKKKQDLKRREFLKLLSAATCMSIFDSPLQLLAQSLMGGSGNQALAAGMDSKRYVYIQLRGAPSRWTFDHFLNPYNSPGFTNNPHMGTRYSASGGRYTNSQYAFITRKGIRVPWLWQFAVPKSGGGNRPMTDLLDNLIGIRGMTTGNPGHPGSAALQFRPLGANVSLAALAADGSSASLPAVSLDAVDFAFKSAKGKTAVSVKTSNTMLQDLLTPFVRTPTSYDAQINAVGAEIESASMEVGDYSTDQHGKMEEVELARQSASDLLATGFPGLNAQWTALRNKYRNLIIRAINPAVRNLTGINDMPIGITGTRNATYDINAVRMNIPDLRNLITASTRIGMMAEHFAVAEYVITNNLSKSVVLSPRTFTNLNTPQGFMSFDEHRSGRMPILYLNSMYNRALASCLLEFIDQLKAKSIFNDTVIQCGGEFNRSPRNDSIGSDHGWRASSMAFYSGSFTGPMVLGNTRTNAPVTGHNGSWGYGATVANLGRPLHLGDLAATVAYMLGTPNPVTAANSLLKKDGMGKIIPAIELAKFST